jgi:phage terminase large subunit-like protein
MSLVDPALVLTPSDREAVAQGCTFDESAADRVRHFFARFLRHGKGEWAGKPFDLLPWQWERIVRPLFGWRRADGTRRFRRAGIWVPKKNGKSTLGAGLSLYLLVADGEAGAEVYSAAADREQASIVFREAASMVRGSPALSSRIEVIESTKRLVFASRGSWYKALSADAPTKEGLNTHGLIFDELHAQRGRNLWDVLTYGGAARRQPLFVSISTAGYDRGTIGYEQYLYARQVIAGEVTDPAFFAYIAEAGPDDDWTSPDVWRKANPSYGVTIKADQFESDCKEAQASPAKENAFRRYRLNQWTESDVRWLSSEKWAACSQPVDLAGLEGRPCWAGLDLSSTLDLTALVLAFPLEGGEVAVLPYFWAPESACKERERRNRTRYDAWARSGHLEITEGDVVDYDAIRQKVMALHEVYDLKEVAIDRWNATQLAVQLGQEGISVVLFGQGFASMSAPSKRLEELVTAGKLRHGGHPVLGWCAANVVIEQDAAANIKPSKKKSTEKVDGIVALVMALGRLAQDAGTGEGGGVELW